MTSVVPLVVAFCVLLQGALTQTGILEKRTEAIRFAESTECTCTCQVKVDTPIGQGHSEASSTQNEEGLEGGWSDVGEDSWPSDDQLVSDESPMKWPVDDHQPPFYTAENANKIKMADNELDKDAPDRYKGISWGHGSRYPWKSLKDTMCIRQSCQLDSDCCLRWNICDRSAKVCTNCWYGHPCRSERDCCADFPYCQRKWKTDANGQRSSVESGRCADQRS